MKTNSIFWGASYFAWSHHQSHILFWELFESFRGLSWALSIHPTIELSVRWGSGLAAGGSCQPPRRLSICKYTYETRFWNPLLDLPKWMSGKVGFRLISSSCAWTPRSWVWRCFRVCMGWFLGRSNISPSALLRLKRHSKIEGFGCFGVNFWAYVRRKSCFREFLKEF